MLMSDDCIEEMKTAHDVLLIVGTQWDKGILSAQEMGKLVNSLVADLADTLGAYDEVQPHNEKKEPIPFDKEAANEYIGLVLTDDSEMEGSN